MEYRTNKQFERIVRSVNNGNWMDASKYCVEYGFYSYDLMRLNEKATEQCLEYIDDEGNVQMLYPFSDIYHIVILVERATQFREYEFRTRTTLK